MVSNIHDAVARRRDHDRHATPASALGMKPTPQYLKAGDMVTLGIQGLGDQRQKVVAFKKRR